MGAWGYGPFDSDAALDYLADLAHRFSRVNGDGDVDPATVDRPAVIAELRGTLTALANVPQGTDPLDTYELCVPAYAAAGLVAAARDTTVPATSTGTRLFATFGAHQAGQPAPGGTLGLDSHCGYRPADLPGRR